MSTGRQHIQALINCCRNFPISPWSLHIVGLSNGAFRARDSPITGAHSCLRIFSLILSYFRIYAYFPLQALLPSSNWT